MMDMNPASRGSDLFNLYLEDFFDAYIFFGTNDWFYINMTSKYYNSTEIIIEGEN